nr:hypothetical protein BaRGS_000422 [Batillaria attramentaria]
MMIRPVVPTVAPNQTTTTPDLNQERSQPDTTLTLNTTLTSLGYEWRRLGVPSRLVHQHWLDFAPLPYSFHVCVGLFMIATAVSSLIGNGLVLWSVIRPGNYGTCGAGRVIIHIGNYKY